MNITENQFNGLYGLYAVPTDHPFTCGNPAPWKIIEMRFEINPIKIWIRGENSMWFRADNCFIHTQRECEIYQEWHRPNDARERNEAHQE